MAPDAMVCVLLTVDPKAAATPSSLIIFILPATNELRPPSAYSTEVDVNSLQYHQ